MKKRAAALLTAALVGTMILTGCGNKETAETKQKEETSVQETTVSTETAANPDQYSFLPNP